MNENAVVVLVHGLWMTGVEMGLLRWRLRRCGFRTRQFHYHSLLRDLPANASRLQRFLSGLPGGTVHFVAHSLGGLVVRQLFSDFPDQRPGRIVTLGTPHGGSAVACRLEAMGLGPSILGHCRQSLEGKGLPPWQGAGRELGNIAGDKPFGVGRLFGVLSGPNDGTVALAETRLPGAEPLTLPVTHTGLLASPTVARETCQFLLTGHFFRRTD